MLSLNFYLGVMAWVTVVYFKIKRPDTVYAVYILLFLALFNIVVFTYWIDTFGDVHYLYRGEHFVIVGPGLSPTILLCSIIYFSINRKVGLAFFKRIFSGSNKEQIEQLERDIAFYYNKFKDYNDEEFGKVNSRLKCYPESAQVAIKRISEEREN